MKRVQELQKTLKENTAALVTTDDNRFYLSGMRSSAGTVLVTPENAYLIIDFRYFEKASKTCKFKTILLENMKEQLCELLAKENIKTVLCETEAVSVDEFKRFEDMLSPVKLSDSDELSKNLSTLRSIKSEEEISLIKEAQKLTDDTFSYILNFIKAGKTEREIMLEMEFYMRKLGSEGVSFDFIVVSGKNSSLPHGVPTDKVVENGDFVTMDFGAVVGGYRSDMTRTIAVGHATDEMKKVYETVLEAQIRAINGIKAGVLGKEVDALARDYIYGAGYEGCFGHGTGHSVGIFIHENPSCNPRGTTPLEENVIMTVEPGIYLPEKFGVRIEDMVIVKQNGCENITKSEKKLIVL